MKKYTNSLRGIMSKKIVPIAKKQKNIKIRSKTKEKVAGKPIIGDVKMLKLFNIQMKKPTRISAKNFNPARVRITE
jgi:hypothetical protein